MSDAGGRFVLHALGLGAAVGVFLTSAWVAFWVGLTFDPSGMSAQQVHQELFSAVIGCALLVVAAGVLGMLRVEFWLVLVDLGLAGLLAIIAVFWATSTGRGYDTSVGDPWHEVMWMWTATPTTWPMLLLLVAFVVLTGWSRLARR
jgi:hypothetical protein